MNELTNSMERRNFLKASGMLLGAFIVPSGLFGAKMQLGAGAKLGSSLSIPISLKGKRVGLKLTIVNNKYVIGTLRSIRGKKLTHFYIVPQGSAMKKYSNSFSLNDKKYNLSIDPRRNRMSSNLDGLKMGPPVFNGSDNDDVASAYGFWSWLAGAIADVGRAVSAAVSWMTGGVGSWKFSNGSRLIIWPNGRIDFEAPNGGFKSEPGLEESPNIWF